MMLTEAEIQAIRYYMGDTKGNDPFWGDPKAYVALNSLFFSGIRTEQARAAEGKRLNPALLEDTERLRTLLCDLLSACKKCALTEERYSFRVERFSDYAESKAAGRIVSFTSTSTEGFLSAYADRRGIALMEFSLPPGTPCIPMAEVLSHYAKADEAEILLPPGLVSIREQPVPEKYRTIQDADRKPPLVYAKVQAVQMLSSKASELSVPESGNKAGMRVYEALMAGECPSPADVTLYSEWKQAFVQSLR